MKIKILVTGGCGYIASHTIVDLIQNGFEVVSADSHVRSNQDALAGIEQITGVKIQHHAIDLCDAGATAQLFAQHPDIKGVVHFAALKSVPESVQNPLWYYQNNLGCLLNVLIEMGKHQIPYFIFSSSCSVYGNTTALPVVETTPFGEAESPYARTKQMGEQMVRDASRSQPQLKSILLRYFNPAGAHPSLALGEIPQAGAYNMVPLLTETGIGLRQNFTVFGSDYPTRDGSCVRDYIYIMDLANAHTRCLQYLVQEAENAPACDSFNVGIGQGVTVLEAIKAFEKAANLQLPYQIGARRAGDVAAIYANYEKAAALLGWHPQHGIEDIMRTAWAWQLKRSGKK